jgi:hypothetical protein
MNAHFQVGGSIRKAAKVIGRSTQLTGLAKMVKVMERWFVLSSESARPPLAAGSDGGGIPAWRDHDNNTSCSKKGQSERAFVLM